MTAFLILLSVLLANAAQNDLKPYENKSAEVHGALSVAFPRDYHSAREAFQLASAPLVKERGAQLGSYKIPNRVNSDLTIDHLYIPAPKKSDRLLIVTSGIHGAEAYLGSAIELMLLQQITNNPDDFPYNILIIHGLNPYGFKFFRRTNENNVDLNRNFATPEEFKSENKNYKKLHRLFNPPGQANAMWVAQTQFYLSAVWNRVISGKKTILGGLSGQYHDSHGPFYGGNQLQTETIFAQYLIKKYAAFSAKIYHVDLHTGFGEKGRMHLIASKAGVDAFPGYYRKIFEGLDVNTGHDEDFYPTTGDMIEWTRKAFPDKIVIAAAMEMGTMDSQTTMGGIKSLWIAVVENQGYHRGYNSPQSGIIGRLNFVDLFNPQDKQWQDTIIRQAKDGFETTLERFKKL